MLYKHICTQFGIQIPIMFKKTVSVLDLPILGLHFQPRKVSLRQVKHKILRPNKVLKLGGELAA